MSDTLTAVWLGQKPYAEVFDLQQRLFEARKADRISDLVLLLEHDAVITMGRGSHQENLLASRAELERRGVGLQVTDRGGDVTLHAPGQLVAYPIVGLRQGQRDVRKYVKLLQRVMQSVVAEHGVGSGNYDPHVGLWADLASPSEWPGQEHAQAPAKLGAIGVRISRWTTMHGFALNLSTDLALFRLIVPCGIRALPVASVESLTGSRPSVRAAAEAAHRQLANGLDLETGGFVDRASEGSAVALTLEALGSDISA